LKAAPWLDISRLARASPLSWRGGFEWTQPWHWCGPTTTDWTDSGCQLAVHRELTWYSS